MPNIIQPYPAPTRLLSALLLVASMGACAEDCELRAQDDLAGDLACEAEVGLPGVEAGTGVVHQDMHKVSLPSNANLLVDLCNVAKPSFATRSLVFGELEYTRNGTNVGILVLSSEYIQGQFHLVFDWVQALRGWTTGQWSAILPATPVYSMPMPECNGAPLIPYTDDTLKIAIKNGQVEVRHEGVFLFARTVPGIGTQVNAYPLEFRVDNFRNDGFSAGAAVQSRWRPRG